MDDPGKEMAQQEEPLYDFPEPSQPSQRKLLGHQRGRGSLRSISVLDRLLLTVPVWLQLSINPANALHILRREPPGNFLVRKSRTSQRNVLCVRLADDSVPSFVQQFGIIEEQSSKTLSLETSAISFPDLPRLISFYCVSRDVLPFPLELPDAIAKATSHKELESISHMGIEFWSSHLNVRGPREAPKPRKDEDKKQDTVPPAPPAPAAAAPQTSSQLDSAPQPDNQLSKAPESDAATEPSGPNTDLFREFCPITTRSPSELDYGSGMGALCFINPLFLQSQTALCRRRMFKRSLKVRISTETSTLLSPPLAPPPPPPLMPKAKRTCKLQKGRQGTAQPSDSPCQPTQIDLPAKGAQLQPRTQKTPGEVQPPSASPHLQPEEVKEQTQIESDQSKPGVKGKFLTAQLTLTENFPNDSDYMKPSPVINPSNSPFLSPYLSPSGSPMAPPLFPKVSPSISPRDSPGASPSLSPYQSPSLSPKVPFSLSPYDSPSNSPSRSPYESPSASPKVPFSLSPFTSQSFPQLIEQASCSQASPEREADEEGADVDGKRDGDGETKEALHNNREEEERSLVLQMNAASLNDAETCSPEDVAETRHQSLNKQADGTSL
ncbi:ras and Rab interactor 2-like [Stegastes partitus]|uniref:Ras and Rab interactor 2-like n=1 Tax=Stegastes partitus TaxID=144197 RepID=A0A9Y4NVT8_9TELE|nr:PREDICTED: ras and Rab interactor 2-like [Stegastes partitus]